MKFEKRIMMCVMLITSVNCCAKNTLPSINRIKKKVEQALEQGSHHALQDLIQKTNSGNILVAGNLLNSAVPSNPSHDVSQDCDDLEAVIKNLHQLFWSVNQVSAEQLKNAAQQSREQALKLLNDMIIQRCGQHKVLFKAFAVELEKEEAYLLQAQTTLQNLKTTRRSVEALKESFQQKVQVTLIKVMQLQKNLNELMVVIDQLLMRS